MKPSLIHLDSLIGNLGIDPNFSRTSINSPGAQTKQKNKLGQGNQIVINVNGTVAEKRDADRQKAKATYKEGYYAVFLDNDTVYFGKLQRFPQGAQFIVLKDVYYLKTADESAVLNFDLIKLGSEIHSPEDKMHININKILFWEKLQDEGPIVTAILNYKEV